MKVYYLLLTLMLILFTVWLLCEGGDYGGLDIGDFPIFDSNMCLDPNLYEGIK